MTRRRFVGLVVAAVAAGIDLAQTDGVESAEQGDDGEGRPCFR